MQFSITRYFLASLALCLLLSGAAAAQNATPRNNAPQNGAAQGTGSTAPAATGRAARSAQEGAAAATRSSRRTSAGNGSTGAAGRGDGSGRPARSSSAQVATGSVGIVGDSNSDGKPDRSAPLGLASTGNSLGIAAGTPIIVKLARSVDSGSARNGDVVQGSLVRAVRGIAAGSPVRLTVVATARAGQISSAGTLSMQVQSVNGNTLLTEIVSAEGREGKKDLADSAPATGTEAQFAAGEPFTFPAA